MENTQDTNKGDKTPNTNTKPVRVKKEFLPRVVEHAARFDENGNLITN